MEQTLVFLKTYDVYRTAANLVDNFPKKDRYALGVRLENELLSLIGHISTAEVTVQSLKERSLIEAQGKARVCSVLLRLCMDRELIKETNYFRMTEALREIEKMTFGWRKSFRR